MSSTATSPTGSPRQGSFQRFWRALRQVFLEVAGAIFAVFGIFCLNAVVRSWNRDIAHWLIGAAVVFALLFFFFAASSFRRARKL